jgi:phosphatidate cytidylyltransferase
MKFSNLGKRMLFVVWAVPLGWWLINSTLSLKHHGVGILYPGQVAVMAFAFLACYEYTRMLATLYSKNGFWLSYLWLAMQFTLHMTDHQLPHSLGIYLLLMIVAIEAFIWGPPKRQRRWVRASLLFSGTVFLYVAPIALVNFYYPPFHSQFKTFAQPMLSQLGIALVVFAVAMCDSVAYFTGSLWGKHHFSTISPNKTIEGAIGGFMGALIACAVGWWFLADPHYPRLLGVLLGILIGVFAQIGDLLVSLMKRYFQVKDSSDIIPGHGGILDRFGSLLFTAPAISLFSWFVNMLIHI